MPASKPSPKNTQRLTVGGLIICNVNLRGLLHPQMLGRRGNFYNADTDGTENTGRDVVKQRLRFFFGSEDFHRVHGG